ncbi:hypothetical protein R0135_00890 [Congregibacter variabilis]|uniref:Cytochrome c domain-containing protein n=1 Tax=Congregibacter variabilis TaxID=3081200 RepID=A0ABZ0I3Y9_9GAMM|nr:hypothetical protein R0135_00890 [Congregibacter sp. IMCC43200]
MPRLSGALMRQCRFEPRVGYCVCVGMQIEQGGCIALYQTMLFGTEEAYVMKKILVLLPMLIFLFGCEVDSRGFVLPDGDIARGKQSYKDLACNQCHSIADVPWLGAETEGDVQIPLGGAVTRLKTYGELVTSVINPSHRIARSYLGAMVAEDGESNMQLYNDVMTVQQLVDIVEFLQSEYEMVVPGRVYQYTRF